MTSKLNWKQGRLSQRLRGGRSRSHESANHGSRLTCGCLTGNVLNSCAGSHLLVDRRSFYRVLREVDVGGHYSCVAVELRHILLKRLSRLFKEMRGVSEAAETLLNWYLNKGREKPYVNPRNRRNCTVVEGYYVDQTTGVVCGRHLDLDANNGSAAPFTITTGAGALLGYSTVTILPFRTRRSRSTTLKP